MKKVLVIDDEVNIGVLLTRFLGKHNFDVSTAVSGAKALEMLKERFFDLILCDFRLEDTDGKEMLAKIKELHPSSIVIIITGYSDIKIAVEMIKMGAYDYISKPLYPDEILETIHKALDQPREEGFQRNSGEQAPKKESKGSKSVSNGNTEGYIMGESEISQELYRQIDLVAPTNFSIILFGESGTGKEAVAQRIHQMSKRKDKPFVAVDCGSLTKELAGSELFGHEKGSFTGALGTKIGHFETANGGTLLLDEVANLSYDIQVSLLRVVQERKVKRIGSTKEIDLDVRIVVASNEDLWEAVGKGKFREDLFHRFNEFSIYLPPLREREEDIMLFAQHFLESTSRELGKEIPGFDEEVIDCFETYHWPGNIREMKNVIRRAALLTPEGKTVSMNCLPLEMATTGAVPEIMTSMSMETAEDDNTPNLKNVALEAEYETILKVLKQVNYNKTKAAKILNIDRKTLYNKMKAMNLT
ncbi:two-component system response regulator HydG [Anseongella ginsenosidimutans]|uniref:Two-component system response regulator HydG n=1 Tax=Anseongella ginsenosidimutans TaxID=496056 RepID=A0A4R3KW25_9SPHI|nr:sigma-54 dependent transcriptional regulator [Anseongella ginsenosidimutans]QEC51794.1 sigma-54-dependent Fis family transcriptional regulator [Anseongella ginsenosidimutans]TCS89164.1 two-component system response regulator HydG [Anseongella ginsenosidimutans]